MFKTDVGQTPMTTHLIHTRRKLGYTSLSFFRKSCGLVDRMMRIGRWHATHEVCHRWSYATIVLQDCSKTRSEFGGQF